MQWIFLADKKISPEIFDEHSHKKYLQKQRYWYRKIKHCIMVSSHFVRYCNTLNLSFQCWIDCKKNHVKLYDYAIIKYDMQMDHKGICVLFLVWVLSAQVPVSQEQASSWAKGPPTVCTPAPSPAAQGAPRTAHCRLQVSTYSLVHIKHSRNDNAWQPNA